MRKVGSLLVIVLILQFISLDNVQAEHKYQSKIDSLIKLSKSLKDDTSKVKTYYEIANSFVPEDFLDDEYYPYFYDYTEKGYKLSKTIHYEAGKLKYYRTVGSFLWMIGKFTDAIKSYENALNHIEKNDSSSLARIYYQLGVLYGEIANYNKSLDFYHKSLKIHEILKNSKGIGGCLSDIAAIYIMLEDRDVATNYLLKAVEINENNKDTLYLKLNYGNLGLIKDQLGEYKEGLKYKLKALKLDGPNISIDKVKNYINIGNSYLRINDFDKANYYYKLVLDSSDNYNCDICKALGMSRLANLIYEKIKYKIDGNVNNLDSAFISQLDLAVHYLNQSLDLFIILDKSSEVISNLLVLTQVHELKNDYQDAYFYYKKAIQLSDSINSIDVKTQIAELESKRELEIKEKENQLLLKNNELINVKLIQNNQKINLAEKEKQIQHLAFLKEKAEKQEKEKQLNLSETQMKLQKSQIESLDKEKETQNAELRAKNLQRNFFIAGVVVFIVLFLIAFVRFREKKKLSDKLALQNAEIENQKRIVEEQKELVEEQKEILQEKNNHIYASITYASTIQHAILPWDSTLQKAFSEILIFYKPKDIVSGDSYWFQEVDGIKFLAVIDCTGHGIPGAMLTVIASTALDDAVLGKRLSDTGQILTYMNEKVTEVLNQRLAENKIRDGMEVALIAIYQDKIQFSGAGRPLYMRNVTMEIIKTDKRGIAGQTDNDEYQFSAIEIEKSEDLMLYLASDGFADQMNENSKKYSTKRFVALLDEMSDKPVSEQYEIIENEFNRHKGERSQIDDVTILGVRI